MSGRFNGKVVLITGGTSGIGRDAAVAFAREGAKVVVTGRREEEGAKTVELVNKAAPGSGNPGGGAGKGSSGLFVRADATREEDAQNMVKRTVEAFGGLDIAFNNAGLETTGPITQVTVEEYRKVFDINVLGVMLSLKYQIPAMLARGGGSIINNASIAGTIGMANVSVYIASKHAVIGLTKSVALEYARQGIRVNAVSPAAIRTDMYERFTGSNSDNQAAFAAMHPVGRVGEPREVSEPVLFLASDAASFITGHNLNVDGGYTVP